MKVRIGYTPGAFPAPLAAPDLLRRYVEVGEACGYDSIWLSDRIVGGRFPLEPIVALSMVAAYSEKLKFGPSVLAVPLRQPVLLAKQLATLDFLSNGRLLPAVGLGSDMAEYEALGVPPDERGARADEAIEVLRRLWRDERVTFEGRFFTLHDVGLVPRPVQQPAPPIWIGGRTKAAQRRVGRVGDGWLVSQATPAEVAAGVEVINTTAAACGRSVDADHIGAMLGFFLAPTPAEAAAQAGRALPNQRTDVPPSAYSALGPPEVVADVIRAYVEAGATKFVVRPLGSSGSALDQLARFGRDVLPHFHQGPG